MKRSLLILLVVCIFLLISLATYWYSNKDKDLGIKNATKNETTIQSDFKLESSYQDNNLWSYRVTGSLPNVCYKVNTQSIVMESYPEQVVIKLQITLPDEGQACAQAIYEYEYEGTFQASKEAKITLQAK